MITHYLPQWLLEKFRSTALYELDIYTGKVEQRSKRRAGSGDDLWPEDVETAVMSRHDNRAATIYRDRIAGRMAIRLSIEERTDFALWLALFYPRVPSTADAIKATITDPAYITDFVYENRDGILDAIRKDIPEKYAKLAEKYGKSRTDERLLADVIDKMKRGGYKTMTPDAMYHHYLRDPPIVNIGRILAGYRWTWLRSVNGFVIGDNPLLRWHVPTGRYNYGISQANVETTMPLNSELTLLIEQSAERESEDIVDCGPERTRTLNVRQRWGATSHVYAGEPGLLVF